MGMKWGNMNTNIRGIITHSLSPYEQKAFVGVLKKGVPNMIRRISDQFFIVVPPFFLGYMLYDWAIKEHERLKRKDCRDYEHDE